jgi:hypothetical protein
MKPHAWEHDASNSGVVNIGKVSRTRENVRFAKVGHLVSTLEPQGRGSEKCARDAFWHGKTFRQMIRECQMKNSSITIRSEKFDVFVTKEGSRAKGKGEGRFIMQSGVFKVFTSFGHDNSSRTRHDVARSEICEIEPSTTKCVVRVQERGAIQFRYYETTCLGT